MSGPGGEHELRGPGDDPAHERLVLAMRVLGGSTMQLETGNSQRIYFLDIVSRSLASADEIDRHTFGVTGSQLAALGELINRTLP